MIRWADIEDAMQQVVTRSSGLTADRVLWSYQSANEPDYDHVVINFGGAMPVGIDRIKTSQDLSRPNGEEILQEVRGIREVPFDIEVFTEATYGDAAARHLAELIRTRFRLDSNIRALRKVQLSVFDISSPVQWIPYVPSAKFRGRAVCTVRCYVPVLACFEYAGYIARVRGTVFPSGYQASGFSGLVFDSALGA